MRIIDGEFCASSARCANTECARHFGEAARAALRGVPGAEIFEFVDYRETCGEFRPAGEQPQQQATEAQQS